MMGTRAIIEVKGSYAGEPETLCTIYRHYDGYPQGLGVDIKAALQGREVRNGVSGETPQFNGPGCMAAHLIKSLKDDVGNVYIYAPGSRDCGEEFYYSITAQSGKPITVKAYKVSWNPDDGTTRDVLIYDGTLDDWKPEDF